MKNESKISAVISTYNHGLKLFNLLDYIDKLDFDEILVVEDHDNKEQEVIRKLKTLTTKTRLIITDKPYGPWATKRIGIQSAKNNYLLHLDGDCIPVDSKLKEIHLKWLSKGYLFVFGNILFDGKSILTRSWYARYCLSSSRYVLEAPVEFDSYHIAAITANNFSMNKKKLFDSRIPDFGLYAGEEIYFIILNLRRTNLKALFDPNLLVKHNHPLSLRKLVSKYYTYAVGSGINRKIFGNDGSDYYLRILMAVHLDRLPMTFKKFGVIPTTLFLLSYPLYGIVSIFGFMKGLRLAGNIKEGHVSYKEIKVK